MLIFFLPIFQIFFLPIFNCRFLIYRFLIYRFYSVGWLNDNFKKEFLEIFSICSPGLAHRASAINTEVTRHALDSRRQSRAVNGFESRRPSEFINHVNGGNTVVEGIEIGGNNNSRRPSPTNLTVPVNGDCAKDVHVQAKKFLSTENTQCFV